MANDPNYLMYRPDCQHWFKVYQRTNTKHHPNPPEMAKQHLHTGWTLQPALLRDTNTTSFLCLTHLCWHVCHLLTTISRWFQASQPEASFQWVWRNFCGVLTSPAVRHRGFSSLFELLRKITFDKHQTGSKDSWNAAKLLPPTQMEALCCWTERQTTGSWCGALGKSKVPVMTKKKM